LRAILGTVTAVAEAGEAAMEAVAAAESAVTTIETARRAMEAVDRLEVPLSETAIMSGRTMLTMAQ
jgi:hypothetical protein